jgi:hypothetical protein
MNKSYEKTIGKKRGKGPKIVSKAGRKEKPIDWQEVDDLLLAGCTGKEIAAAFDMHPDSFYPKVYNIKGVDFSEYAEEKREAGNRLIRNQQFLEALGKSKSKGNTVHLSKLCEIRLGQKNDTTDASQARAFVCLFQKVEKLESALQSTGLKLSDLENQQPLLDQGHDRSKDPVSPELGTEGIV